MKTLKRLLFRLIRPLLQSEDVEWVVTHQEGELGVRVCGKVFTLYKGESLYHPDGQCRRVEKREFGEAIKSIQHLKSRPPCP